MALVQVTPQGGVTVEVSLVQPAKSFNIVAISGQSDVVASAPNQTLNFVAGSGIVLTTDALTDTITITSSGGGGGNVDGGVI